MKDKGEIKERLDKGNGVLVLYRKDGTAFASVIVGDFPFTKWEQWEKDCKINFSRCRWAKMVNDHEKAKAFDLLVQDKFQVQNKPEEPKEEELFGGETLKKD